MKKLALAAALTAAFAGSAYAQSSVQIYGRINTTIEYQDNDTDTVTGMKNNASRFGFMGKEDLGSGLNAFFQLEAGFDSSDGSNSSGNLFAREANVGLESASLGKVKLGRIGITSLYGYTIDWIGVFNHDTGTTAEDNIWALPVSLSNAVEYTTPKFLGGALFAAFTAAAGENTNAATYEGVLVYQKGDLHLAGGYTRSNERGVDQSGWVATGAYAFGPLLLGLSYDYVDQKNPGVFGTTGNPGTTAAPNPSYVAPADFGTRNSVTGTAMYTLGASEFHLSVGWADNWDNVSSSDATQFTLGYNYNLSKRTKLYGFYYQIDNGRNSGSAITYGSGLNNTVAPQPNDTFSSIGLGIRHNF